MTVHVIPIPGMPEVAPGDDLPKLIDQALTGAGIGLYEGDVLAVTQKVVSKAEGRLVPELPEGRDCWVAKESRRLVARRGELVIAQTRHGFVCANAGVDASNVKHGLLTLLPVDPDASAQRIRSHFQGRTGTHLGVVITDTFGRPWRRGLVNVAIGCAGLPAMVDLRGTKDAAGRVLEATIVALADEVAAASGLVMGKAERIPAAVVRGLSWTGAGTARELVRPPDEDMFPESPLLAITASRSVRGFGGGSVPRSAIEQAVLAACGGPAGDPTPPWRFAVLDSRASKRRLLDVIEAAPATGLAPDSAAPHVTGRRERSDAPLREAAVLAVPCARLEGADTHLSHDAGAAGRKRLLLSGGAAIQRFMLALRAQGLASHWALSTPSFEERIREALGLEQHWIPLGVIGIGPPPADGGQPPEPEVDPGILLRFYGDEPRGERRPSGPACV